MRFYVITNMQYSTNYCTIIALIELCQLDLKTRFIFKMSRKSTKSYNLSLKIPLSNDKL